MKHIENAVDKYRELILKAERAIWATPETGYKEFKTSEFLAKEFESLGYELTYAEGITGFYTVIDTKKPGPEVLILAELDSIICPTHKDADKKTGAVHSCGHNAQCAALLGIAAALREEEVSERLWGKVRLCAVPAEELLEIEYRTELIKEGTIKYYGGKSEFLSRGYFDGVDIAFMVHTSTDYHVGTGAVGCIAKSITYKGQAAHAGGAPWQGKNALYAANCGINAANALRETFKEADIIRFHPIITSGGSMVNAIPEEARLESYVRGASFEAMVKANKKINQGLIGAALSLDNNIIIDDMPGYSPLTNDKGMIDLCIEAAEYLPEINLDSTPYISSGSTDMGDLSCIMPVVHPYAGGATGKAHGNDYEIADPEQACVLNAKWQLIMLTLLLENEGAKAKEILKNFKPLFESKEAYLTFVDSINSKGARIEYTEDGAKIKL